MAKHLTPAQRAAVVARYQLTANASEVAREFEISEATVRRYLSAANATKKNELHARAVARGIRAGRRFLVANASRLDAWLREHGDPNSPTMEPGDVARMSQALRVTIGGMCEVEERVERKSASLLSRNKTRAEIAFLKARTEAISGLSSALQGATDEELATVAAIIERARRRGGPTPSDQERASATDEGDRSDPSAS